ncbi:MAG TPA: hypothetical protein VFJ01_08770 [Oleiagrimonas sp.]|nr:hypothetical protein [Oleiagrimonas sp.]
MQPDDLVSCPGVLALELAPGDMPTRPSLERDEADTLAAFMADDLRALLPGIEQGQLAVVGAHFDSTELLRPGFPTYTTLDTLAARMEGGVLAFGTRDGHMPAQPLAPEAALAGGALRLIPWTILVDAQLAETVGPAMEVELVGRGEAGERTADYLMRQLGMRLEHARYFSRHDLMALVCVHYEHVNLAPLWALIEAALLSPERTEQTLSAHGLTWRHADGHALAQTPGQWLTEHAAPTSDERIHALAGIVFELRQYAALLSAHRIPLAFADSHYDADGAFVVDTLAAPDPAPGDTRLYAHEAPGLGVIALTVAQMREGHTNVLANAWPLSPQLDAACHYLAEHFNCPAQPEQRGRVQLDSAGQLGIPK